MAEDDHAVDHELLELSAAFDGEGEAPTEVTASGRDFVAAATEIRRRTRVTAAEPVPDLTDAVLAELEGAGGGRRARWRPAVGVAAAFVIGVVVSAAFFLGRGLDVSTVAAADITDDLVAAQVELERLDATVTIVERGAHPAVPERSYVGTLAYRSPERLSVHLDDVTRYPSRSWIPNDVVVVVADDLAWRTRGLGCPVDALPDCLGPVAVDAIAGRTPFSPGWAAPLDIVVPAGDLLESGVDAERAGDRFVLESTVRESQSLVDAIVRNGTFRQVHATDAVVLELDATTLQLRRLEVIPTDVPARRLWATTWGYDDVPGTPILEVDLVPVDSDGRFPATPPVAPAIDAGFREGPVDDDLVPAGLPAGFEPHRSGTQSLPDERVDQVASWSDGRAWITVRASEHGQLGPAPTAERVALANGIGYVDRVGRVVDVFTTDRRFRVAGSLPAAALVDVAASLPVVGIDAGSNEIRDLPDGVLLPADVRSVVVEDDEITIVTAAGDGSTVVVRQHPDEVLAPPPETDSYEIAVRATVGRHSATYGTLSWLENGWVVELSSVDADITALLDVATSLQPVT